MDIEVDIDLRIRSGAGPMRLPIPRAHGPWPHQEVVLGVDMHDIPSPCPCRLPVQSKVHDVYASCVPSWDFVKENVKVRLKER